MLILQHKLLEEELQKMVFFPMYVFEKEGWGVARKITFF